jgi:hypothetical protein
MQELKTKLDERNTGIDKMAGKANQANTERIIEYHE